MVVLIRDRDAPSPSVRFAGLVDRLTQALPDVVDQAGAELQEPPQVGPATSAQAPHAQRPEGSGERADEPQTVYGLSAVWW